MATETLKAADSPTSAIRPTLEGPSRSITILSLEPAVRRLHWHLLEQFPFSWRLVIVDNAWSPVNDR